MLNPSFLSWNSAVSLLVSGNVMFIHITVPAEISVELHHTYMQDIVQLRAGDNFADILRSSYTKTLSYLQKAFSF